MKDSIRAGARIFAWLVVAAACLFQTAEAKDPGAKYDFHIEEATLGDALTALSRQSQTPLLYPYDLAERTGVQPVHGEMTLEEALGRILQGTDFSGGLTKSGVIAVSLTATEPEGTMNTRGKFKKTLLAGAAAFLYGAGANAQETAAIGDEDREESAEKQDRDVLVVTGTRIKGARPTSPVVTVTQEEMRLSGQNNLGDVIRSLPQNFNGGQNPGVAIGASGASGGGISNFNYTGGSSLSLRGLGPDATLTLLNGSRLPYDGISQATDVSVIPVAAIERVEVLLDGASALYGSDAVGGVANIILKRDFEGAEISARYGFATEGGYEQQQYSAVFGDNWGSGGFLVTGDYSKNDSVKAGQRNYLDYIPNQDVTIYPKIVQKGGLFSGHQEIGEIAELAIDAFYMKRRQESFSQTSPVYFTSDPESNVWGVSPSLRFVLPAEWSARLHGFVGRNESEQHQINYLVGTEIQLSENRSCYCNNTVAAGVEMEGPLLELPGGELRFSLGGGYRKNRFRQVNHISNLTPIDGSAQSYYLYGEANVPLISEEQDVPLVNRLILNGALRYEKYDSFGKVTTPKVGVLWTLLRGLDLKASWGRSFKAPTLVQQFQASRISLYPYPGFFAPDPMLSPGAVIATFGGNPNLEPERAEMITAGFVAAPEFLPGLTFEFNWFDIDYTDRVVQPLTPFAQIFVNPIFSDIVTVNPSLAEQNAVFTGLGFPVGVFSSNFTGAPYDPMTIRGLAPNTYLNASAQYANGVDLTARYSADLLGGNFTASANASWVDMKLKLTGLAPEQDISGVVYFPADFRGRFGASWSRDEFTIASFVNHIGGVTNNVAMPAVDGEGMTTIDLTFDYRAENGPFGTFNITVAVTNLLDEAPPHLEPLVPDLVNFDSTNYSALGRNINITLRKSF